MGHSVGLWVGLSETMEDKVVSDMRGAGLVGSVLCRVLWMNIIKS